MTVSFYNFSKGRSRTILNETCFACYQNGLVVIGDDVSVTLFIKNPIFNEVCKHRVCTFTCQSVMKITFLKASYCIMHFLFNMGEKSQVCTNLFKQVKPGFTNYQPQQKYSWVLSRIEGKGKSV